MPKIIIFGVDGLTMPLLKKYMAEGILPNIARMFAQGSAAELLPFISAWGDLNWVSLLTGQCPGTAWIGQGMPADNRQTVNLLSLMEDKRLHAALVHFPETVAAPAPHFPFAPYWGRATPWPAEIAKPMGFSTASETKAAVGTTKTQTLGWPPSGSLAYHDKGAWQPLRRAGAGWQLTMRGGERCVNIAIDCAGETPTATFGEHAVDLPMAQWSHGLPVTTEEGRGSVRFYLGRHQPHDGQMDILQCQMTDPGQLSADQVLAHELVSRFGPFISKWTVKASPEETYRDAAFAEAEAQSLWLADSALYLTGERHFSLWATVHRLVDESHHNCLGQCDPQSPFYQPETAQCFEDNIRRSYQVLDKTLGYILDRMDGESTLLLVSDHGAVPNAYLCDIHCYLAKFGLVALDRQGRAVLESSKVYLKDERGGLEIYVNLRGRETGGIVCQADYESVREEVLHALGGWHVRHQGRIRNAVALALRKEDAVGIGYWGEHAGDIVFAYNTGFVWGVSADGADICPVTSPGANHGPQKPTAETDMASNYGVIVASGAGIRSGYYRDRRSRGPYRMVDPAATIARLLNLDSQTLDGVAMEDFLADTP
ncbi:alkaline phosphatase family protein [Martelella alba]|uniref:Type I phosphodiesterase / nucleotide pyrophosphatase n=1 Tax=Martelella alba TaxID=2590451 RepID=A0ABY2SRN2_9HYPH|nr:alkaline phosphatase family protein [Martelella alba]TKI08879.1 hypothetical protein FCN80_02185 [Martelella alba]